MHFSLPPEAILARARGFAEVTWTDEGDDETYSDTETFFDNTITVWSGASECPKAVGKQ